MGRKQVNHIGETKVMNCGAIVTITGNSEKENYYKMRVSDGFEFDGRYQNFKNGNINPDCYKDHVGETKTMNCGAVITISGKSKRKSYYKMRTSDGFEFDGLYHNFKNGNIEPGRYRNHIGETKTMRCGTSVTITEATERQQYYKMCTDDGFEFEGHYCSFQKGTINPDLYKTHIGETKTMKCGSVITIIGNSEKENCYRMRSSDGFEFEGLYPNFKKRTINPSRYIVHIGETKIMNCGLCATCIAFTNTRNITIKFEDDRIRDHISYSNFFKGCVLHPDLNHANKTRDFHGYRIISNRFIKDDNVYYIAIRLSDGEKVYMTPQMMMAAEKNKHLHI